ncbi:hypothetical protein [Nocardioides sp. URHA0020]|uniref:hypothetical protein n=1 Tax=Nocardioides sp. URHA0020 TaxID=1380392 RepID=UPI0006874AFD|nr:hypothetical protein [Nocardioides sp. URHA0020]
MTRFNRWCVVALGVLLVIAVPVAINALPARDPDVTASALLERIDAAEDHPWSGYVQTEGALELPVADDFSDVGALVSDRTRMRAWWRSGDDWRVDRLLVSGETDLVHQHGVTIEWSYERNRAQVSRDPDIRLPRAADLVPPVLAERLLRDVVAADVRRVPARRVAGRAAPGLRVVPAAPQSSVDHVDLWADPASGVPLRVEVYADGDGSPSFVTELRGFSSARPAASATTFASSPGIEVTHQDVLDIADAANQYAPLRPPASIAGLPMSSTSDGAVGVYGVGITQLIAIPLRRREADPLREQLRQAPDVTEDDRGTLVTAGPLGVLVTGTTGRRAWLLTGTVTATALYRAAGDLARGTTYLGERR